MTHDKHSGVWFELPWKDFQSKTFQLQKRIYKASRNKEIDKVKKLQTRLFGTYEARMIAIRQVTQLNDGKKTAGIDGQKSLSMKQRLELEQELHKHGKKWRHKGLREINIPKPDGTLRTLKIPTIRDRAWQCLVKIVIEPAHEANFNARSYGFRPGRSTHDAQKFIYQNLNSKANGKDKRVIELDIEKCFDRINHKTILDRIIAPQFIKTGISKCLKIGVSPEFPEQGTPQGGVISPLLANIALDGIENIHPSLRYADDMIFFLKPNDNEDIILSKTNSFLTERGMNISNKKTQITTSTNGFDFLAWYFVTTGEGKLQVFPSKNNYNNFKKKVKAVISNPTYGATEKIIKLAPIIRGWRNYHKYCNMSKHNLWNLEYSTWKRFNKLPTLNKRTVTELIRSSFPRVPNSIHKFVNVRQDKSPFDGDIVY
jgi:RNA-directed DNA polymerase